MLLSSCLSRYVQVNKYGIASIFATGVVYPIAIVYEWGISIIQSIVVDCKKLDSLDETTNKSTEIGRWRIYISPNYYPRLLQQIHKQNEPVSKSIIMKSLYFLKKLHIVIVCTNGKNNVYNGKKCLRSNNLRWELTMVWTVLLKSNDNWLSTKVTSFLYENYSLFNFWK